MINFYRNNTRPCYGKCFSNRCPPRDANSVTAVGCGPVGPILTFMLTGDTHRSVYVSGCYGDSVRDGYRILLILGMGTH